MKLAVVGKEGIADLIEQGKKEGLIFNNSTRYYQVFAGGKLVGMTGMSWKGKTVYLKNHFILPEYRRQGFFKGIMDLSIQIAKENGFTKIEATCTPLSIGEYMKRGAVIVKEFKNGCTQVRINL